MAETLRELVVALSLDLSNFSRNMRTINRRALVAANNKLKENYDRHQDYTQRLEQAKAR